MLLGTSINSLNKGATLDYLNSLNLSNNREINKLTFPMNDEGINEYIPSPRVYIGIGIESRQVLEIYLRETWEEVVQPANFIRSSAALPIVLVVVGIRN
jgi:hypothetical protein